MHSCPSEHRHADAHMPTHLLDDLAAARAIDNTRIADWVAAQCNFALSEAELDREHDEFAQHFALRESKLLPDDFHFDDADVDYVFPMDHQPPKGPLVENDEDKAREPESEPHSDAYDLFPAPPSDGAEAQVAGPEPSREEALEHLVREMNSWRVPCSSAASSTPSVPAKPDVRHSRLRHSRSTSNRDKPLPSIPSSPVPFSESIPTPPFPSSPSSAVFPSWADTPTTATSPSTSPRTPSFPAYSSPPAMVYTHSHPPSPIIRRKTSPKTSLERPGREHVLAPAVSLASLRDRSSPEHTLMTSASYASLRARATAATGPEAPPLVTSASYASLRSRASRFPSISTTLSFTLEPALVPTVPTTPSTPTLTVSVNDTPPLTNSSSLSSVRGTFASQIHLPVVEQDDAEYVHVHAPAPARQAEGYLSVYPQGMDHCVSRWSVGTSVHGADDPPPLPRSTQASPTKGKSIRKRVLSSLGFKSRSSTPKAPPPTPVPSALHSAAPSPMPRTPLSSAFPIVEDPASPTQSAFVPAEFALRAPFRPRTDSATSASLISASGFAGSRDASCISNAGYVADDAFARPALPSYITDGEGDETITRRKRLSWARPRARRLVVSGLARDDARGEAAVRAWCEGFGEVRKIVRRSDGAIEVRWKSADVADTVCRLQAQVHIQGAGSVVLSWVEDKRRF